MSSGYGSTYDAKLERQEEQKETVVDYLIGTCNTVQDAANACELLEDRVNDILAEQDEIELCTTCGWWCEMGELEIIDDEHVCQDCRDD